MCGGHELSVARSASFVIRCRRGIAKCFIGALRNVYHVVVGLVQERGRGSCPRACDQAGCGGEISI